MDETLSLGDLFNPATFINALRQQTARRLETAIDRVKMICSWDRDPRKVKGATPLSCSISNLVLQGAAFSGTLKESTTDASEMAQAPTVCIGFVPKDAPDTYSSDQAMSVPIYLSPTRETFLTELQMPVDGAQERWVLAGVALFLSEDE